MWYITQRTLKHGLLTWGPVLVALTALFIGSALPKYPAPPGTAPMTIYFSGMMPVFPGMWEVIVKKSGHVIAFGVLAVLNMRALLGWRVSLKQAAYLAIIFTMTYAMLDEMHQSFVPGRHASGIDIGVDFIGVVLFTWLLRRVYPCCAAHLHIPPAP